MTISKLKAEALKEALAGNFMRMTCWNCEPDNEKYKQTDTVIECRKCDREFYKGREV